ncbi:hypothetical protein RQP46_008803 [Phenoliferia psychrophenolica]
MPVDVVVPAAAVEESKADVVPAAGAAASTTESPEQALVTQIEFYLSDSNLPFDKFLFTLWASSFTSPSDKVTSVPVPDDFVAPKTESATKSTISSFHQGWIPLSTLTSFKRMRAFLDAPPAGLGSMDTIAATLISDSNQVETRKFADEWFIRRTMELARPEDAFLRSAYVKGFPVPVGGESEAEQAATKDEEFELQKKLEAWVRALGVGKVKSLRMRREDKPPAPGSDRKVSLKGRGKFKGSIFVEFDRVEAIQALLSLDPKPTYEGKELEMKSKADYVEEKRKIYAPDSKPITPAPAKNPYTKTAKPFNAWAESLVGANGIPSIPVERKRKAEEPKAAPGPEDREVLYDGVRFTARRDLSKGPDAPVEIVDLENVGTGPDGWPVGKVFKFTIARGDGSFEGETELGAEFDFGALKAQLMPLSKPAFVSLLPESRRPIAPLPSASSASSSSAKPMDVDAKPTTSEFPARLTAPPSIATATPAAAATDDVKPEAPKLKSGNQPYPAKGQASFKDSVTDETFAKLQEKFGVWEGRKMQWTRVSAEEERAHAVSRAQFHAQQAFDGEKRKDFGGSHMIHKR